MNSDDESLFLGFDDNPADFDFNPNDASQLTPQNPEQRKKKRRTVQMKWTDAQQEKLISEVEKYKCLYDEGCAENRDKNRREVAWKSVSDCFGDQIPEEQCRAKWMSLRAVHRKILKELSKRKSGQGASTVKPNWKFFDNMKFIVDADKKNKMMSESNLVNTYIAILYNTFNSFP